MKTRRRREGDRGQQGAADGAPDRAALAADQGADRVLPRLHRSASSSPSTIYNILIWPFVWVAGPENTKFIYTALLEYFCTQLKLAMFGAAFISFPMVAAQIYMFVAPGLYRHEREAFLPYLVATPIFFSLGALGGLFHRDADDRALLARHAAVGGRRAGRDRAAAQGRRISVADDVAGPRLRRRVPASGDPDAARPHRHPHVGDAARASGAISSSARS